ncbi:hypothetical protein GWC77_26385 [Paraburkholderia sp. NMBU_R16]|uniref:hypothetical protein n=1 Tax=Paraburkholderia sp. NMBU_R16 TaxID=2698676 RepID=UPI001565FC53|nr:hypothetical protein [Paraburkholderia sp. NMBU_R16]NRO99415.1 hypothetical protein [Paraburkholderia sp. NMBU_R16]
MSFSARWGSGLTAGGYSDSSDSFTSGFRDAEDSGREEVSSNAHFADHSTFALVSRFSQREGERLAPPLDLRRPAERRAILHEHSSRYAAIVREYCTCESDINEWYVDEDSSIQGNYTNGRRQFLNQNRARRHALTLGHIDRGDAATLQCAEAELEVKRQAIAKTRDESLQNAARLCNFKLGSCLIEESRISRAQQGILSRLNNFLVFCKDKTVASVFASPLDEDVSAWIGLIPDASSRGRAHAAVAAFQGSIYLADMRMNSALQPPWRWTSSVSS